MPAWYVAGSSRVWVIIVHGYGTTREEGIRPMPVLRRLGFPILDISYRNDSGSPLSPDHLYHLGATEWKDLQAAVRYALSRGAKGVILYGYSMGGGIVEDFMHHSSNSIKVRAVVLDSPALDWYSILDLAAEQRDLPLPFASLVEKVVAWRLGMSSLDAVDQSKQTSGPTPPVLVFHGLDDTTVPITSSDTWVHHYPGTAVYYRVPRADHTQSWNVNPSSYDAKLEAFLKRWGGTQS